MLEIRDSTPRKFQHTKLQVVNGAPNAQRLIAVIKNAFLFSVYIYTTSLVFEIEFGRQANATK